MFAVRVRVVRTRMRSQRLVAEVPKFPRIGAGPLFSPLRSHQEHPTKTPSTTIVRMKSSMLALMAILGTTNALLVPGSGARRSVRSAGAATQSAKATAALTAFAAFAWAPSAMAATDGVVDLGSIQSIALEVNAAAAVLGLPAEKIGIAVGGVVVVGGGGFFLQQQAEEKAQQERDAAEARREAEFLAMKKRGRMCRKRA